MQQPIAPLEGISAHFSNMYRIILKEMRGWEIFKFSSWVDVTTAAGPVLLRLGGETKMVVFWSYFQDFVGAQKIKDLFKSKIFSQKYFKSQVDSFFQVTSKSPDSP